MRRIAHYDYWSNTVRRSIIEDSRADILVYGMAKCDCDDCRAACNSAIAGWNSWHGYHVKTVPEGAKLLPAEEDVLASKETFLECYRLFYRHQSQLLAQPTGKRYLSIIRLPQSALTNLTPSTSYRICANRIRFIKSRSGL